MNFSENFTQTNLGKIFKRKKLYNNVTYSYFTLNIYIIYFSKIINKNYNNFSYLNKIVHFIYIFHDRRSLYISSAAIHYKYLFKKKFINKLRFYNVLILSKNKYQ